MVDQDGGFEYNTIPGIFSPSGDQFVQGDYLIFTGDCWTKLNEYSFSYQTLNDDLTIPCEAILGGAGGDDIIITTKEDYYQ